MIKTSSHYIGADNYILNGSEDLIKKTARDSEQESMDVI